MSNEDDMTATEIGNSPGFKAFFRFSTPILQMLMVTGIVYISGYVRDTSTKINVIGNDVDRIKWELPAIRETSKADKTEMLAKLADTKEMTAKDLQTLEGRIRSLHDRYEMLAGQINEIRLEMAKQANADTIN